MDEHGRLGGVDRAHEARRTGERRVGALGHPDQPVHCLGERSSGDGEGCHTVTPIPNMRTKKNANRATATQRDTWFISRRYSPVSSHPQFFLFKCRVVK